MKRVFFPIFLAMLSLAPVFAQKTAMATIEFAEGDDVAIVRDGSRLDFDDALGLELAIGDQVQTGKRTFLQIRLETTGGILKIAENTTFLLKAFKAGGETAIQLTYGRIRAKVEKLAGNATFNIQSANAVAGVRGTDFGYDVITPRTVQDAQSEPVTQVYCFQGAVDVTTYTPVTSSKGENLERIPQTVRIGAGEMVDVEKKEKLYVPSRKSLTQEIRSFWRENDFKDPPPVPERKPAPEPVPVIEPEPAVEPAQAQATGAPVPPINEDAIDIAPYVRAVEELRKKQLGLALLGVTTLSGLVCQGTGAYFYAAGDAAIGLNMIYLGTFVEALGLPIFIMTIGIDPEIPIPGIR